MDVECEEGSSNQGFQAPKETERRRSAKGKVVES